MKTFMFILLGLAANLLLAQNGSFHDFTTTTLEGEKFELATLKGKKILVVNVASKCGLTPQYEQLEELYQTYKDSNFVIIGFPANNFMKQEPGTANEIREFCTKNYGVTFPIMEKISVKGKDIDPIYKWLTSKSANGQEDAEVKWNFQKFMIDEHGSWIGVIEPSVLPTDKRIVDWIQEN